MRVSARGVAACLSAIVVGLSASAAPAQTQAKSLKDQLVGHWQLVSVMINGNAPYGSNPQGSMFIDAAGHFSVVVISGGNARNIAYFGTYTVDDASHLMTLHIDGSSGGSGQNAAGRDLKRSVSISGDQLIVANQTPAGAPGAVQMTWKQAD